MAEGCWKIAGRNGCSDRAELGGGSIGGGVSVGVGVVVVSTSILLAGVMYYLITLLTWRMTKFQGQAQWGRWRGASKASKQRKALLSGIHQINPNPNPPAAITYIQI